MRPPSASNDKDRCFVRDGRRQRPANRRYDHSRMLYQAHQLFDIQLTRMEFQIGFWLFTHQPLFTVLQVRHTNNAEVLAQNSRSTQQIIRIRVAGITPPF